MARVGKFLIETWGCQMNDLDSARLAGQLVARGWTRTEDVNLADVVVLNTCSVREKAEEKVYSALGRLAVLKQERPSLLVGVAGCVAQQEGEEILSRKKVVDFVLGTGNVDRLGEILDQVTDDGGRPALLSFEAENPAFRFDTIVRENPLKSMVTVVEGCDKYCTFCIVPFTRGRERSRRRTEIIEEIRSLVGGQGSVEVLLLGQTVNAYRDPETGEGFGSLLRAVSAVDGLRRIRFVTSHPADVNDDMIEAMKDSPKICRYLHLPPQSGSDRMLARMKRQYSRQDYLRVVERLRTAMPEIALSGDVIVGFPGESESEFLETLQLVEEVRFSSLYTFKYSPRPGTAATRWDDHIAPELKDERLERLGAVQNRISREENLKFVGRSVEVLVDGPAKKLNQLTGRTDCNRIVNFSSAAAATSEGLFRTVRVEKAFEHSLAGAEIF